MGESTSQRHIEKTKALCPFCFRSFSQIYRHKCKIAPPDFQFDQEICTDEFFLFLYRENPGYDSYHHRIDLHKLDRTNYRHTFIQYYYARQAHPEVPLKDLDQFSQYQDQEFIYTKTAELRDQEPSKPKVKSYFHSKIHKICPFCGDKFIRLDLHKCEIAPEEVDFSQFRANDQFYIEIYEEAGGWDERGFLLPSYLDLEHYSNLFLQIYDEVAQSDLNEAEIIALFRELVQKQKSETSTLSLPDANALSSSTSSAQELVKEPVEKPKSKATVAELEERFGVIEVPDRMRLVCPFCSARVTNIVEHSCSKMPSDILLEELEMLDSYWPAIFYSLYKKLDALNKYGKLDPYKLNYLEFRQEFLKTLYELTGQIPHDILPEQKALIMGIEPDQKTKQQKKEGLSHKERVKRQKLEEKRAKIENLKNIGQVCPFCFKKLPSLAHHTCNNLPPEFMFHPIIEEAQFFKKLYKFTDGLNKFDNIDEYRLNHRRYRPLFLKIYNRLVKSKNPSLQLSYHDQKELDVVYPYEQILADRNKKPQFLDLSITPKEDKIEDQLPQVCPYCFTLHSCLYSHHCDDAPENFAFDIQLYGAPFFKTIYQDLGSLNTDGVLNFYKFDRNQYKKLFFREYKRLVSKTHPSETVNISSFSASTNQSESSRSAKIQNSQVLSKSVQTTQSKTSIAQPSSSTQIPVVKEEKRSEILYILDQMPRSKIKIREVCPFCLARTRHLGAHSCKQLPDSKSEDFHFSQNYLTEHFFLYLYNKLDVWLPTGRVDDHKIHPEKYRTLFIDLYEFIQDQQDHSVDQAIVKFETQKLKAAQKKGSKLDELEDKIHVRAEEKKQSKTYQYKQICPWCFNSFEDISNHSCEEFPDTEEQLDFTQIPKFDLFFGDLYRKVGALNKYDRLDPYRLNHTKYQQEFLTQYHRILDPHLADPQKQDQKDKSAVDQDLGSLDDLMADFDMDLNDSSEDMDMLEFLDQDLGSSKKKAPSSKASDKIKITSTDEPVCFSCEHMIDCPRGLDSNEMMETFECREYDGPLRQTEEQEEEKVPLCFSCPKMINCPRNITSDQMEMIFECKYFDLAMSEKESLDSEKLNADSLSLQNLDFSSKNQPKSNQDKDLLQDIIKRREEDQKNLQKTQEEQQKEKEALIDSIMQEWQKERGELKVYCKKCESIMKKIVTSKKTFYRCSNYPLCKIEAEPWYVQEAQENKVKSQRLHADTLILYQYDAEKNIVWVSEIYSEGKIFT